jgi:hypothetical protein
MGEDLLILGFFYVLCESSCPSAGQSRLRSKSATLRGVEKANVVLMANGKNGQLGESQYQYLMAYPYHSRE